MAKCAACGREIRFARNPDSGKSLCLDAHPMTLYEVAPGADGRDDIAIKFDAKNRAFYLSHFVTCPHPERFSRRGHRGAAAKVAEQAAPGRP